MARRRRSGGGGAQGKAEKPQQRNAANARERARMRVLSRAFCRLKTTLPWVPADTKLSKLDTLRLATSYIAHLRAVLADEPSAAPPLHPLNLTWPFSFQHQQPLSQVQGTASAAAAARGAGASSFLEDWGGAGDDDASSSAGSSVSSSYGADGPLDDEPASAPCFLGAPPPHLTHVHHYTPEYLHLT